MATEFIFVKAANVTVLREEIEADAGITTALDFIIVTGTDLHINFVTDLSGAEETALNAVVAAHTGIPVIEPGANEPPPDGVDEGDPTDSGLGAVDKQKVLATSSVSTTSTSFVDMPGMSLTTKDLGTTDGCYHIFFSADMRVSSGSNDKFEIRILVAGSTVVTALMSRGEDDDAYSAEAVLHLEGGVLNISEIKIQWRKVSGSTLRAKRRELSVLGVPTAQVLS
ncbi:MAG: hypothetical protein QQN46_04660 [Nitrosopumilus sp.]